LLPVICHFAFFGTNAPVDSSCPGRSILYVVEECELVVRGQPQKMAKKKGKKGERAEEEETEGREEKKIRKGEGRTEGREDRR
jgi:hypothetical protein